jgi:glycosyltransferase involved in cell wall biosynthesis
MKKRNKKIYIVIPAFNEGAVIKKTLQSLQNSNYKNIVVVDDGSVDNTAREVEAVGVEVITHLINRGQGAALRTGMEYILENYSPDIVITFDSDGQHRPQDIQKLIQPLLNNEADIVLGSRFLKNNSNIPFFRRFILKAGVLFTNFIARIKLTDTHNGLRALNSKALQKIKITHRGMEHASDIINEITKNNLRYREVPVKIVYTNYSLAKGQATGNFIKMGLKIILHKLLN